MRLMPLALIASLMPLAACMQAEPDPVPSGAEDYATFCAGCHGLSGRGDGDLAKTLDKRPADLTRLAGADGKIPMARVMSKIWGYTKDAEGNLMPSFAPLLDQEQRVLFDSGDGIATPTPLRLVQVAEHLQTLQGKAE